MSFLKFSLGSIAIHTSHTSISHRFFALSLRNTSRNLCSCLKQNGFRSQSSSLPKDSPLSGMEDALVSYLFGKRKATDIAHMVWKHVIQKGDTVVDATCGNGFDTLEMLRLVSDDSHKGNVYAFDIQKDALDNTLSLLEESLNPIEKQLIKLSNICHSKMEEVVPSNAFVRLSSRW